MYYEYMRSHIPISTMEKLSKCKEIECFEECLFETLRIEEIRNNPYSYYMVQHLDSIGIVSNNRSLIVFIACEYEDRGKTYTFQKISKEVNKYDYCRRFIE